MNIRVSLDKDWKLSRRFCRSKKQAAEERTKMTLRTEIKRSKERIDRRREEGSVRRNIKRVT